MKPELQKAGRNDRCPCGSGRKYKQCHGARSHALTRGQRLLLGAVVAAAVGGLVLTFNSRVEPRGPTTGVWSPEHGHYH
jgi:hypothetical protein